MKTKSLPFNIKLLSNEKSRIAGLLPVASLDIKNATTGTFHEQGLYSDLIFGPVGDKLRATRHGYINIRCQILHPFIFEELTTLKSLYKGIMQGREYALWDEKQKDFVRSDILEGQTGFAFFMQHVDKIKHKKTSSQRRDLKIQLVEDSMDRALLNWFNVMPAGLRDVKFDETGRAVEEEINKLYRKIIIASNTISKH